METKTYQKRNEELKHEVIDSILKELKTKRDHRFKEPFDIYFAEGDDPCTELCTGIYLEAEYDDRLTPIVKENGSEGDGGCISFYATDSLVKILDNLKKELREEKVQTLCNLVKNAGGKLLFDGKFRFDSLNPDNPYDDAIYENTELCDISIEGGALVIHNYWEGDCFDSVDVIPEHELDRVIQYVRSQTMSAKEKLALTPEQIEAIEELKKAHKRVKDSGAYIICDHSQYEVAFVNGEYLKEVTVLENESPTAQVKIADHLQQAFNFEDNGFLFDAYISEDIYAIFK